MLDENGFTFKKTILAVGRSDLRKGIDGLAAMVKLKYGLDPLEKDTLFLFCGVRRDRLKGLLWAGDRFILSSGQGQRRKPGALPRRNLKG